MYCMIQSHTLLIMFIGNFIIQYFLMPPIMVSNCNYITNNIGKAYIAIIMGIFMILLETMMHDHQYKTFSLKLYAGITSGLFLFIYLYRKQIAINDKQYLKSMIEHHSMGILTSEEILKKSENYNVIKIAKNIIQKQQHEINVMSGLIDKQNHNV